MITVEVLKQIELVELKMAELYRSLAIRFERRNALARELAGIADEEVAHADLVRFKARMILSGGGGLRDAGFPDAYFQRILDAVDEFLAQRPWPSLAESLEFSAKMEGTAAESLHQDLAVDDMPALSALFRSLKQGDEAHLARVERLSCMVRGAEAAA